MQLNQRAAALCRELVDDAARYQVATKQASCGTTLIDCGVAARGGLSAGLLLARISMADLGVVALAPGDDAGLPMVTVHTDAPSLACLASQYAGWEVTGEDYFAMGSGPMRALAAREPLFEDLGYVEQGDVAVGVLETSQLPTDEVCQDLAAKCSVAPDQLTLLAAPTRSLAGTLQIVARSVETTLHKLHELKFDLERIETGWGTAPLPPPAADDLTAIGRTNDAILYGGQAVLYVRGDDASLAEIGPQIPSNHSADYGRPFAEVLAQYDHQFYKVDPLLFSPARITLVNLETGRTAIYGEQNAAVLNQSFGLSQNA